MFSYVLKSKMGGTPLGAAHFTRWATAQSQTA